MPIEKSSLIHVQNEKKHDKSTLNITESAVIFRKILHLILADETPFSSAPFIVKIAEKFIDDNDQSRYFTTSEGFGANIVVSNGIAVPNIDLNIQEGLKSRNLRKRIDIRIDKEATDEDIFWFAVGHEIAHLIQGLADEVSIEDQDVSDMTEEQLEELRELVDIYNRSLRENDEIRNAQAYFRLIFGNDIARDSGGVFIDPSSYSEEDYLKYVNSDPEANADFISLWIMGMNDPDLKTSPQSEGYGIEDWQRWAEDHRIVSLT